MQVCAKTNQFDINATKYILLWFWYCRPPFSFPPCVLYATGQGRGVYDRIANEWDLGGAEPRLQGIGALYMAMSLTHLGEFLCENAVDGSDMLSPTQTLTLAHTWVTERWGTLQRISRYQTLRRQVRPTQRKLSGHGSVGRNVTLLVPRVTLVLFLLRIRISFIGSRVKPVQRGVTRFGTTLRK